MSYTPEQAEELQKIENEMNAAAPGVRITRDPKTGKIWYKWDRPLDPIEKVRLQIIIVKMQNRGAL